MLNKVIYCISFGLMALATLTHCAPPDTLTVEVRREGKCDPSTRAEIGKKLTVHYEGFLATNNNLFDSSKARNEPMTFTLGKGEVIEGWEQGLVGMCPGEERTLIVPPSLAYGSKGFAEVIPPDSTLVFEIILMEIN